MENNKEKGFLEHIEKAKSKATFLSYRNGLEKFKAYIKKDLNEVYEERKAQFQSDDPEEKNAYAHVVEEFYGWLVKEDKKTPNSARVITDGIRAFFFYYGMPIQVSRDVTTVKDSDRTFVPDLEFLRKAFNVGAIRDKVVLSLALDLPYRAEDFIAIKKDFVDLSRETPIETNKVLEKEKTLSKSFVSAETVELLKAYIPTLKPENPYLFQNGNGGYISEQALNNIFDSLVSKAKLEIPKNQNWSFHSFRKLIYSACANLDINQHMADLLLGKSVEKSKKAYLKGLDLKSAFLKVRNALSLSAISRKELTQNGEIEDLKTTVTRLSLESGSKDTEIKTLRQELASLKGTVHKMNKDISEDLAEIRTKLGIKEKLHVDR